MVVQFLFQDVEQIIFMDLNRMQFIRFSNDKITVELSKDELALFANALNEVCNGIELWEFDTRLGMPMEDAKNVLKTLSLIIKKANNIKYNADD